MQRQLQAVAVPMDTSSTVSPQTSGEGPFCYSSYRDNLYTNPGSGVHTLGDFVGSTHVKWDCIHLKQCGSSVSRAPRDLGGITVKYSSRAEQWWHMP